MEYRARLSVIQHTSAEYLGLIEDHLEGRQIGFTYYRPFTQTGALPASRSIGDGLVLLGGGPWGSAGPRNLPSLIKEVELTAACLGRGLPVLGIGLGAQILALAAGGKTYAEPLVFAVGSVTRLDPAALNGYLPAAYPQVTYMRDRYEPPAQARVLATDGSGAPALFQVGANAFGFTGHPGFKVAMAEDLIMEFAEAPDDPAPVLTAAREVMPALAAALIGIMTGLVQQTGLMDAPAGGTML